MPPKGAAPRLSRPQQLGLCGDGSAHCRRASVPAQRAVRPRMRPARRRCGRASPAPHCAHPSPRPASSRPATEAAPSRRASRRTWQVRELLAQPQAGPTRPVVWQQLGNRSKAAEALLRQRQATKARQPAPPAHASRSRIARDFRSGISRRTIGGSAAAAVVSGQDLSKRVWSHAVRGGR
jgi:hypothetical protein